MVKARLAAPGSGSAAAIEAAAARKNATEAARRRMWVMGLLLLQAIRGASSPRCARRRALAGRGLGQAFRAEERGGTDESQLGLALLEVALRGGDGLFRS
jgi:hypothetical protein